MKAAMSGLQIPVIRETMLGNASILEVFNISKIGKVAGCRVTDGVVERGQHVRLIRDNVVVHEGKLSTLKHFKDEVKEVQAGQGMRHGLRKLPGHARGRRHRMFQVARRSRGVCEFFADREGAVGAPRTLLGVAFAASPRPGGGTR